MQHATGTHEFGSPPPATISFRTYKAANSLASATPQDPKQGLSGFETMLSRVHLNPHHPSHLPHASPHHPSHLLDPSRQQYGVRQQHCPALACYVGCNQALLWRCVRPVHCLVQTLSIVSAPRNVARAALTAAGAPLCNTDARL